MKKEFGLGVFFFFTIDGQRQLLAIAELLRDLHCIYRKRCQIQDVDAVRTINHTGDSIAVETGFVDNLTMPFDGLVDADLFVFHLVRCAGFKQLQFVFRAASVRTGDCLVWDWLPPSVASSA